MRIGDTVHYVSFGTPKGEFASTCRAAVITETDDGKTVGLAVVNPTGVFFHSLADGGCRYDSALGRTPAGGTWHGMDECNPDGATLSRIWGGDTSGVDPLTT